MGQIYFPINLLVSFIYFLNSIINIIHPTLLRMFCISSLKWIYFAYSTTLIILFFHTWVKLYIITVIKRNTNNLMEPHKPYEVTQYCCLWQTELENLDRWQIHPAFLWLSQCIFWREKPCRRASTFYVKFYCLWLCCNSPSKLFWTQTNFRYWIVQSLGKAQTERYQAYRICCHTHTHTHAHAARTHTYIEICCRVCVWMEKQNTRIKKMPKICILYYKVQFSWAFSIKIFLFQIFDPRDFDYSVLFFFF